MSSALLLKEIHIQRANLLFALLLALVWIGAAIALQVAETSAPAGSSIPPAPAMLQYVHYFFLLPVALILMPLSIGAHCLAPERSLGVWDWQLAQPVSLARQWGAKFLTALLLSLIAGGLMPWMFDALFFRILAQRAIASDVFWDSIPRAVRLSGLAPWIYAPTFVGLGAFASALSRNANRAFFGAGLVGAFILLAALVADPAWVCFPPLRENPPLFLHPAAPVLFHLLLAVSLAVIALPSARLFGFGWRRLTLQLAAIALIVNALAWLAIRWEFGGDQFVNSRVKSIVEDKYPGVMVLTSSARPYAHFIWTPTGKSNELLTAIQSQQSLRRMENMPDARQSRFRPGIPVRVNVATGELHPYRHLVGRPERLSKDSPFFHVPALRPFDLGGTGHILGSPLTRLRGAVAAVRSSGIFHKPSIPRPILVARDGSPIDLRRLDPWNIQASITRDEMIAGAESDIHLFDSLLNSNQSNEAIAQELLLLRKIPPEGDTIRYEALDRIVSWLREPRPDELEADGLPEARDGNGFLTTTDGKWHGWRRSQSVPEDWRWYNHSFGAERVELRHMDDNRSLIIEPDGLILDFFAPKVFGAVPTSSDGRWLTFARVSPDSMRPPVMAQMRLYVKDTSDGSEILLTELHRLINYSVEWSPGGTLALEANDRLYIFRPLPGGNGFEPPRIYQTPFADLQFLNDRYMISRFFERPLNYQNDMVHMIRLDLETVPIVDELQNIENPRPDSSLSHVPAPTN